MVRSPIETGGETRAVDLLKSESTLRTDAAIERWPIGPTGEGPLHCFQGPQCSDIAGPSRL